MRNETSASFLSAMIMGIITYFDNAASEALYFFCLCCRQNKL